MIKENYADGVGQIHFVGGMVRFSMMILQPEEAGKAPVPQENERVIMPLQGFLNTFYSMERLINKLVEGGVLKKKEAVAKPQRASKKKSQTKVKTQK